MKLRFAIFSSIFAIAAVLACGRASADDEPKMESLAYGGYGRSGRGASVPIGYTVGFSFAEHVYAGMTFGCVLGPFETIGNDAQGKPDRALGAGILLSGDVGYEQVVSDHLLVRGVLGLGGYFWSRQESPDSESRIRANGFVAVPGVLVAGLFGPVVVGIETRGVIGTMPIDRWSYGTLLVVGARFDMAH